MQSRLSLSAYYRQLIDDEDHTSADDAEGSLSAVDVDDALLDTLVSDLHFAVR